MESRSFTIIDDTLTLDRRHITRIREEIGRKGLKFRWSTPNGVNAHGIDRELALVMKKAGCYSLSFGMESGNQKTLDWIGKNLDFATLEKAFSACRYAGLESVAFIIIGFPNETREDTDNTINVLKKLKPDVVDFHVLIPLPGTKVYEELKRDNLLLETDWSKYNFHNLPVFQTPYLSRYEIFEEYRRAYRKYHLRPAFITRRLLKMRSKQDFLNNFWGLKTLLDQLWSRGKYQPSQDKQNTQDSLVQKTSDHPVS